MSKYKRAGKSPFRAVDDVSFDVRRSEIVGLVGESGSGKSTIGRALLGADPFAVGAVRVLDEDLLALKGAGAEVAAQAGRRDLPGPGRVAEPRFPIEDVISEP